MKALFSFALLTFLKAEHIAAVYGIPQADAEGILNNVLAANSAVFAAEFAQKRSSLKDTALKKMDGVRSATDMLAEGVKSEHVKGKRLLSLVLGAIQQAGHNPMHLTGTVSPALVHAPLRDKIAAIKAHVAAAGPVPVA